MWGRVQKLQIKNKNAKNYKFLGTRSFNHKIYSLRRQLEIWKFSDLLLIVCGAKTLKLKSLKVQHLATFFRKYFMPVQSKMEPFERLMAFQRTAPL